MSSENLFEKCPKCGKKYRNDGSPLAIRLCNRCGEIYCEYCKGNYNAVAGHVCADGKKTVNTKIIGWVKPKNVTKSSLFLKKFFGVIFLLFGIPLLLWGLAPFTPGGDGDISDATGVLFVITGLSLVIIGKKMLK